MLLGGFRNILEEMEVDNVKPDIKTFTLLLDVIPSTLTAEEVRILTQYDRITEEIIVK